MSRTAGQLTRRQEHALTALMKHGIVVQAAKASHVPESTLRRWLRDPAFSAAYRSLRRKITEHAHGILQQAAEEAAARLVMMMRNETLPPSIQFAATVQVLDRSELSEIEERIAAIEETMEVSASKERLRAV